MKTKVVAKARALAAAKAQAQVKTVYDSHWIKFRRTTLYGKDMLSVSDLLERVQTAKSKKVRSNIGQRLVSCHMITRASNDWINDWINDWKTTTRKINDWIHSEHLLQWR